MSQKDSSNTVLRPKATFIVPKISLPVPGTEVFPPTVMRWLEEEKHDEPWTPEARL